MYLFNHFLKSKSKFNTHVFKNLYWKQLGRACRRLEEGVIGQGQHKMGVVGRGWRGKRKMKTCLRTIHISQKIKRLFNLIFGKQKQKTEGYKWHSEILFPFNTCLYKFADIGNGHLGEPHIMRNRRPDTMTIIVYAHWTDPEERILKLRLAGASSFSLAFHFLEKLLEPRYLSLQIC